MSALPTRLEKAAGRALNPLEIFEITAAREVSLSRLLMLYISTGLVFMLLPGTFLGVWNLIAISSHRAAGSVSPSWIQAHGYAQIFGWIGSFILGIGFYSIPKMMRMGSLALSVGWTSWALWTIRGHIALLRRSVPTVQGRGHGLGRSVVVEIRVVFAYRC